MKRSLLRLLSCLSILSVAVVIAALSGCEPKDPEPSVSLPPGDWNLVFDDSFKDDGISWRALWKPAPGVGPAGVESESGRIIWKNVPAGAQAGLVSKRTFRHGYFEASCRSAGPSGSGVVFSLQAEPAGDVLKQEVPNVSPREFRTHGVLLTEKEIVYFLDGREVRREPNVFAQSPARVLLGAISGSGAAADRSVEVKYVRFWQEKI
jgi:hypothetical protein